MGYVLIALVLAVLGAVVLVAGRWLRAIRELSRGLARWAREGARVRS